MYDPDVTPRPKERADAVRRMLDEMELRPPYNEVGGKTRLASDLQISQPALYKIRHGGGVSQSTARRVAVLCGVDPATFEEDMPLSRFRILEAVLLVHPDRWPVPVIAAARAGAWSEDVPATRWTARLDALAKALRALKTA
jgi:hypothetical protein